MEPTAGSASTCVSLLTRAGAAVQEVARIDLPPGFTARFQLGRLLGTGAMGTVYEAEDRETGRAVAIKFLTRIDDPGALARFLLEGRLLKAIRHPCVLSVLEVQEVDGFPYLVTELVEGSLRQLLERERRLKVARAAAIVLDVLDGLTACHAQGVVHRDLKPENVLITSEGRALLADLGIAKKYGDRRDLAPEAGAGGGSPDQTMVGALIGTPRYMAPEQVRGETAVVASDLHAAGVLLYELITGQTPYRADSLPDLLAEIETAAPVELSRLVFGVPPALSALVQRALSKRSDERPGSAEEMAVALRKAILVPMSFIGPRQAELTAVQALRAAVGELSTEAAHKPAWFVRTLVDRVGEQAMSMVRDSGAEAGASRTPAGAVAIAFIAALASVPTAACFMMLGLEVGIGAIFTLGIGWGFLLGFTLRVLDAAERIRPAVAPEETSPVPHALALLEPDEPAAPESRHPPRILAARDKVRRADVAAPPALPRAPGTAPAPGNTPAPENTPTELGSPSPGSAAARRNAPPTATTPTVVNAPPPVIAPGRGDALPSMGAAPPASAIALGEESGPSTTNALTQESAGSSANSPPPASARSPANAPPLESAASCANAPPPASARSSSNPVAPSSAEAAPPASAVVPAIGPPGPGAADAPARDRDADRALLARRLRPRGAEWGGKAGAEPVAGEKEKLRAVVRERPRDPRAHVALANYYVRVGRVADAEASFRQALQLEPKHAEALLQLGGLLARAGRRDEAERWLRAAVAAGPVLPRVHLALGDFLAESRQAAAADAYRVGLKHLPDSNPLRYRLIIMLFACDPRGAKVALGELVRREPENAWARVQLEELTSGAADTSATATEFSRARALEADGRTSEALALYIKIARDPAFRWANYDVERLEGG